jgi:hypothetical protein
MGPPSLRQDVPKNLLRHWSHTPHSGAFAFDGYIVRKLCKVEQGKVLWLPWTAKDKVLLLDSLEIPSVSQVLACVLAWGQRCFRTFESLLRVFGSTNYQPFHKQTSRGATKLKPASIE